MNIQDILNNMQKVGENTLISKLQIRTESHKIDKRADGIVEQVITWIMDEAKFIDNNLSYDCQSQQKLSEEDKKLLINKLEEAAKAIPGKISSALKDVFDFEEEKEEEKKETPEVKQVEIEITPNTPVVEVSKLTNFGY